MATISTAVAKIRNISALSDEQLQARLRKAGVGVPRGTDREAMIAIARDSGLWDYRGNIVDRRYKDRYGRNQRCGDDISEAMSNLVHDEKGCLQLAKLADIASQNGVDMARWTHLNPGLQAMSLSNVLRGKARRGERVQIGSLSWNFEEDA